MSRASHPFTKLAQYHAQVPPDDPRRCPEEEPPTINSSARPRTERRLDIMVLYIVGLGLGDHRDVTVRGLEAIKSCDTVFLEHYTSILCVDVPTLEEFYGKPIVVADRHMVESEAEGIISPAKESNVALLVVGDPVCATTHADIMLRAAGEGVEVELIHNASVMGAAGCCGLQLYNFGATVSIPYFDGEWRPTSFYPKIKYNRGGECTPSAFWTLKSRSRTSRP